MKKHRAIAMLGLLVAGLLGGASGSAAQSAADDLIDVFGPQEANIEVNLSGPLLGLLSESVRGEDEDFAELLRGLSKVKVRIFEIDDTPSPKVQRRLGAVLSKLGETGWETVVKVRDEEDRVDILVQNDGDSVGGLLAIFMDGENAGFVSIDGRFDPTQLGRLASRLSLGSLANLDLKAVPAEGTPGETVYGEEGDSGTRP